MAAHGVAAAAALGAACQERRARMQGSRASQARRVAHAWAMIARTLAEARREARCSASSCSFAVVVWGIGDEEDGFVGPIIGHQIGKLASEEGFGGWRGMEMLL